MPPEALASVALGADEQRAFEAAVDRIRLSTLQGLCVPPPGDRSAAAIGRLQAAVDAMFTTGQEPPVQVACRAGCSYCCAARVEAFAPEVAAIAAALRLRPAAEVAAVVERMRAHAAKGAALTAESSWSDRPRCPLLVDDRCSIYALRPVACRRAHSLDVSACRSGAALIPQSLRIVSAATAWTEGTLQAIAQAGLDAAPRELVAALLARLDALDERGEGAVTVET